MPRARLHLQTVASSKWDSLDVLDHNDRKVGFLLDCGENIVFRYEVRFSGDGLVVAERDIAAVMEAAELEWSKRLDNSQADQLDASRLKEALDTMTTTVMSIYDEFRMIATNLQAEVHRNVRRPADLDHAQNRYDMVCAKIAACGIDYRGVQVVSYDGKWAAIVGSGTTVRHIREDDFLEILHRIDFTKDNER